MYGVIACRPAPPSTASAGPGLAANAAGAASNATPTVVAITKTLHGPRVLRIRTIVAPRPRRQAPSPRGLHRTRAPAGWPACYLSARKGPGQSRKIVLALVVVGST